MLKEQILTALGKEEYISGEHLAERFGVSRSAVWKCVNALRREGYEIDSSPNRGYILRRSPDILRQEDIERCLGEYGGQYRICLLDTADSTNRVAMDMAAQGAPEGTVVIADTQTAGRGRLGRSFYSPPGSGIYMSLVLRPGLPAEQIPMITACAGTAVAEAVDSVFGTDTRIKWVNDLFLNGRKFCGILSQASIDMETGQADAVVVGIGINTGRNSFPDSLRDIAVSLEECTGKRIPRAKLIAQVLKNSSSMTEQIRSGSFLPEYRRRSMVIGKSITVHTPSGAYGAVAESIDDSGALLVRTEEGEVRRVSSGEVSIRIQS